MPVDHYENFPVASLLVPARLRPAVEALYGFARSADDIADEGDLPADERLAGLDRYRAQLDAIDADTAVRDPVFTRLQSAVRTHALPTAPMRDLLDAFSQDVVKTRYADFAELGDYCRRSANPVGRLMLHLFEVDDVESLRQSDAICTSLQLINFWQDVAIDWAKGRVYLPQDEVAHHGVTEQKIAEARVDEAWRALMQFQVDRARKLLLEGAPLALRLRGRFGLELRLVVQGGLAILDAIEAVGHDVFRFRPTLKKTDWLRLGWRALRMKR
ncbi:squalene synthase HpnC [Niveibacterium sp. SC-1]|uniref:squalene synthase HpnC n=1 Tax=Niveibacterium sp. SC-1 TaxID=3135646 RepID=UPI00311F9E6C